VHIGVLPGFERLGREIRRALEVSGGKDSSRET
jgi:hypothetical protein